MHSFRAGVAWADDAGTVSFPSYTRDHDVTFENKPPIPGTSDPGFRGDPLRYSPEELLVAALAQCHMLWFLHLATRAGVVVVRYDDLAKGHMRVRAAGHGQFSDVTLRPVVALGRGTDAEGVAVTDAFLATIHDSAAQHCFLNRSVNFPVRVDPAPVQLPAG